MGLSIKAYIEKYGTQIGNTYWTVRKHINELETVKMGSGQVFIEETEANLALCKSFQPERRGPKVKKVAAESTHSE